MFRIFFRKVVTVLKKKKRKVKPIPPINCLGRSENNLPRSRKPFSCLAEKSYIKSDLCRLHGHKNTFKIVSVSANKVVYPVTPDK